MGEQAETQGIDQRALIAEKLGIRRGHRVRVVDKRLPEPLYHQIYSRLRDRILAGAFEPDEPFPSEAVLLEVLNVSRITVRRALDELAARGLIIRQQGRANRVAPYKPAVNLRASVEGLIENNRRMAEQTDVDVLEFDYVPAGSDVAAALNIGSGDLVQRAVRVRSLKGVPFSFILTHLPEDIGRTFRREELSSTALIDLLERSGVEVARADQVISAVEATPAVARALQVEAGKALLHTTRVVCDQTGRPVQLIEVQYRPDIYQYSVSLERTTGNDGNFWSATEQSMRRLRRP